jgi:hypothetical protein
LLGRLDSRQPGVGEARPVKIDGHPHEPAVLIGLEAQHIAVPAAQRTETGS